MTHDPTTREGRDELRRLLQQETSIGEWRKLAAETLAAMPALLDALDAKDAEISELKQRLETSPHPVAHLCTNGNTLRPWSGLLCSMCCSVRDKPQEFTAGDLCREIERLTEENRRLEHNWLAEQKARLEAFDLVAMYGAVKAKAEIERLNAKIAKCEACVGELSHGHNQEILAHTHCLEKLNALRDAVAVVINTETGRLKASANEPKYSELPSPAGERLARAWRESA